MGYFWYGTIRSRHEHIRVSTTPPSLPLPLPSPLQVAGASEACVDAVSLMGFSRLKALSTAFNDQPHAASRWGQGGWTQSTSTSNCS